MSAIRTVTVCCSSSSELAQHCYDASVHPGHAIPHATTQHGYN